MQYAAQVVDLKNLTDAQLIAYFQQQAITKERERWLRRALKGKDVEKEHKFWNTQVYKNMNFIYKCMGFITLTK